MALLVRSLESFLLELGFCLAAAAGSRQPRVCIYEQNDTKLEARLHFFACFFRGFLYCLLFIEIEIGGGHTPPHATRHKQHLFVVDSLDEHMQNKKKLIRLRLTD